MKIVSRDKIYNNLKTLELNAWLFVEDLRD